MNKKFEDKSVSTLYKALLYLETAEECSDFLEDLCTITEINSMAQRLEVAQLLNDKIVYTEIAKKTGASTATISRVGRSLNYGTDGYRLVLDRLDGKI